MVARAFLLFGVQGSGFVEDRIGDAVDVKTGEAVGEKSLSLFSVVSFDLREQRGLFSIAHLFIVGREGAPLKWGQDAKKRPYAAVGWLWYVGTPVPMNVLKDSIGSRTLPLASGWPWALHPVKHDESRKPLYCGYSESLR
jgi:hypothetical protein